MREKIEARSADTCDYFELAGARAPHGWLSYQIVATRLVIVVLHCIIAQCGYYTGDVGMIITVGNIYFFFAFMIGLSTSVVASPALRFVLAFAASERSRHDPMLDDHGW